MKYIVTLKNDSMIDYRKIDFGNTDAQTESQNNPKLLIEGYYDLENWTERLLNGSTFLVVRLQRVRKNSPFRALVFKVAKRRQHCGGKNLIKGFGLQQYC